MAMAVLRVEALCTPRWSSAVTPPVSSETAGMIQKIRRTAFRLWFSRLRRSLKVISSTSQWAASMAAPSHASRQPARAGSSVTSDERISCPL